MAGYPRALRSFPSRVRPRSLTSAGNETARERFAYPEKMRAPCEKYEGRLVSETDGYLAF
jgi:hypothetical protein